jgi:hypothetical protein
MTTEPFEDFLAEVIAVTEAGSRIDFGYRPIISTEAQLAGVPAYVRDWGAPSFEIFMNYRGRQGEAPGLPDIDDRFLPRLCEAAGRQGGMDSQRDRLSQKQSYRLRVQQQPDENGVPWFTALSAHGPVGGRGEGLIG